MPSLGAPAPMEAGTGGPEVSSEVINHSNWRNHGNIMGTWVTIYIVVKFVTSKSLRLLSCVLLDYRNWREELRMHPSQSFHV